MSGTTTIASGTPAAGMPASLLGILATYNNAVFLDTDPGWRQFICDHKNYLKSISPIRQPSQELMTQVRQDLARYLRYIGVASSIAWIVGYINDLDSDMKFDQSKPLYVPDISRLNLLYQSYITTKQVST